MIVTAGIAKGGAGKTTLLRLLISVAAQRGFNVVVIDADTRRNMSRWAVTLRSAELMPENVTFLTASDEDQLADHIDELDNDETLVFIDTEGTANRLLQAGVYYADIVVVPFTWSMDDVTTAIQMVENVIPRAEEDKKAKINRLLIRTRQSMIDRVAKKLEIVKALIADTENAPVAHQEVFDRVAYRDLQTGSTLYNSPTPDPKAIAESEALFDEIMQAMIEGKAA